MAQVQVLAKYTMLRFAEEYLYTPDFEVTSLGATPTEVEAGLYLDGLEEFWDSGLATLHDDQCELRRLDVQGIGSPPAWHFYRLFPAGTKEGDVNVPSGERTPNNLCLVTSFYGTVPGRSRQGRVYQMLQGAGVLGIDPNYVVEAYSGAQNLVWESFNSVMQAAAPAANPFHNVWSYALPGGTPVQTYLTGDRVDTQRRRLPRGQ